MVIESAGCREELSESVIEVRIDRFDEISNIFVVTKLLPIHHQGEIEHHTLFGVARRHSAVVYLARLVLVKRV
jgi:hypothetical protein